MIVLDTNVISELMRPQPHPQVLAWVDGLDPARVAITTVNEAEILHGIAGFRMGGASGAFSRAGMNWWPKSLQAGFGPSAVKRPMATADAVIAAIALAHGAQLATRDVADFADLGLGLINPWEC